MVTVAVVTGTRAEYGILRRLMRRIEQEDEFTLSVVATGMHLSVKYGHTVDDIYEDGFESVRTVEMLIDSDSGVGMAKSLGIGIAGLAECLDDIDPDIVVVLGDRGEALAAGVAAAHIGVPVGHIHGGDSMNGATIDDSIRHALTKFAHVHFPASERSAERIRKLGEEEWRITPVGALGLDEILDGEYTPADTVRERYDINPDREMVLVVQHPLTVGAGDSEDQMRETLDAVGSVDAHKILIYPNSDQGGDQMIDLVETWDGSDLHSYSSLPREDYLGVLALSDAIVGNSSSAIIEAPSLGTPVVDIGPRQDGRERADYILSVPHDSDAIEDAVERCLNDSTIKEQAADANNPYDFGGAADNIVNTLRNLTYDEQLLRKRMTY